LPKTVNVGVSLGRLRPTRERSLQSPMNYAALVLLIAINKESWADSAERDDDTLPPLPLAWLKDVKEDVGVWCEKGWTTVEKKKK